MYLVRPDGSSWGREWDWIVFPRIKACLVRKVNEAAAKGMVTESQGRRQWAEWSKGFASPEWDGSTFDKEYGLELLGRMGQEDGCQKSVVRLSLCLPCLVKKPL